MTHITLTTEQAQQIYETLLKGWERDPFNSYQVNKALATIRAARAQEQAERVTEGNGSEVSLETEAQEPVAWWNGKETVWFEHEHELMGMHQYGDEE